jgi:hypothetical protein
VLLAGLRLGLGELLHPVLSHLLVWLVLWTREAELRPTFLSLCLVRSAAVPLVAARVWVTQGSTGSPCC